MEARSVGHDRKPAVLFMTHRGALVNYASRITGDHAHAEDVVQEAYLRFDAVNSQSLEEPLSYLYRIVRNLALDGRRRTLWEQRHFTVNAEIQAGQVPADHPSPEAQAVGKAEMRAMYAAMQELPARSRVALEMHRFGGCKLKDIAAHLGISVGLAHALVVDGLEHCRARLCRTVSPGA